MLSQQFVSITPAGTVLEVVTGPERAVAAELAPPQEGLALIKLYGGAMKRTQEADGTENPAFEPWKMITLNPKLEGDWLYVWMLYRMAYKFLCKGERELEGQLPPKIDFSTFAANRGMDKTELIDKFDNMAEVFTGMGGYPIHRHKADDFIIFPWQRREFILDSALTRDQLEANQVKNAAYMADIRATMN